MAELEPCSEINVDVTWEIGDLYIGVLGWEIVAFGADFLEEDRMLCLLFLQWFYNFISFHFFYLPVRKLDFDRYFIQIIYNHIIKEIYLTHLRLGYIVIYFYNCFKPHLVYKFMSVRFLFKLEKKFVYLFFFWIS